MLPRNNNLKSIQSNNVKIYFQKKFPDNQIIQLWEKNNLQKFTSFSICSADHTNNIHFSEQMALELSRRHLQRSLLVDLSGKLNASYDQIDIISPPDHTKSKNTFIYHLLEITKEIKSKNTHYCGYIISSCNTMENPENVSILKSSDCKILTLKKNKTRSSDIRSMLSMFDTEAFQGFISL